MEPRQEAGQEIKYYRQVTQCGKPQCKKCREGTGHGPYWYAYRTVNGRTVRTYIGKHLPSDVLATLPSPASLPSSPSPPAMTMTTESPPAAPGIAASQEQQALRILVLGQFRLERRAADGKWQAVNDASWQHQRIRATLACLLSGSGRLIGREQLLDLLWSDLDLEVASARLDRTVYDLRRIFEPERTRLSPSSLLLTSHEILALADQSQLWVDADAFEELAGQVYDTSDPGEKEHLIEQAIALYGGDYFPDVFLRARESGNECNERVLEEVSARRELLQRSWIGLLIDQADLRIARGSLRGAVAPLQQVVSVDPTNEAAVQRLMKLFAQMGQRSEALRTYKRLAAMLQREYRIMPLPETRAVYESLLEDKEATHFRTPAPVKTSPTQQRTGGYEPRLTTSSATPIGRAHQSPLVGREEELRLLRSVVIETERASKFKLSGQKKVLMSFDILPVPQSILLLGEAGIGKTRLAEEIAREVRQRGWSVVWSRIYAQENNIPYCLWIYVLRQIIGLEIPGKQSGWLRQEVTRRPLLFQPLSILLPELYEQLPSVALPSPLLPEQEQLRLWEATYELLLLVSEHIPLFIVLDDLQWTDRRSCELFAYLVRRLQGYPVVIVGTCRERELLPEHALYSLHTDLQREQVMNTVSLSPLSDEQIQTLIAQISSHVSADHAGLSEPLVRQVSNRAAGNPFFAEELTRAISTHLGTSTPTDTLNVTQRSMLTPSRSSSGALLDIPLPETITAAIDLRLGQLSVNCQRMLSKAAILGGTFEFQVISTMEAATSGLDEDSLLNLLEEALQSGLLAEEGSGTQVTYHFWHPLLVSRLYEKLSASRHVSLHRRAAEIFQKVYEGREEEGAAIITKHLVQGDGDAQKIAYFAELAGERAYRMLSYSEAEQHYQIALARNSYHPEKQLHCAYLLECLGECIRVQGRGRYEVARQYYEQALAIRQQYYPVERRDALETQIQALLWCEIGGTWHDQNEPEQARRAFDCGERMLREAGIVESLALAYICFEQAYSFWTKGDYEEALLQTQEAVLRFEDPDSEVYMQGQRHVSRIQRILAGDPMNRGRIYMLLGMIKTCSGRSTEGLADFYIALDIFEQYNCTRDLGILLANMGNCHIRRGEFVQAEEAVRRALSIARSINDISHEAFTEGNLGILALRTGDLDTAIEQMRIAIKLGEKAQDEYVLDLFPLVLAYALSERGRLEEAGPVLRDALRRVHINRTPPYIGMGLVTLAVFRLTQVQEEEKQASRRGILLRVKGAMRLALSLQGIEAETRVEAQSLLAQALLLLGEVHEAYHVAERALEDAGLFEVLWLVPRIQRTLGSVLAALRRYRPAKQYFEQSLHAAQSLGMQEEYLRTQHAYQAVFQKKGKAITEVDHA